LPANLQGAASVDTLKLLLEKDYLMLKKPVTLKDLAEELGVSISTVSRALRDSHEVGSDIKSRVRKLAAVLDYHPNPIARGLLQRRRFTVGIVVPSIGYYYNHSAIAGIEQVLTRNGYSAIICQSLESREQEALHVRNLVSSQVDGIIASMAEDTHDTSHFDYARDKGIPIVFFDRAPELPAVSSVVIDNREAARIAVEHLIGTGCRRLLYFAGPEGLRIAGIRYHGFLQAIHSAGLPASAGKVVHCPIHPEAAYAAMEELLAHDHNFDGVFAVNDRVAMGLMNALQRHGVRVPDDVTVIGFNNEPYCDYLQPSLSSIAQPSEEMGSAAAGALLRHLEAEESSPPAIMYFETRLVIRESTGRIK
jgi:DNA-binding LacI/PurR family transcriptional regulator